MSREIDLPVDNILAMKNQALEAMANLINETGFVREDSQNGGEIEVVKPDPGSQILETTATFGRKK